MYSSIFLQRIKSDNLIIIIIDCKRINDILYMLQKRFCSFNNKFGGDFLKKRLYIKIILLLIFIIGLNYTVLKSRAKESKTLHKEKLIVGMELKFPPFETVDESGAPSGVSVDLAKELGDKLGVDIEIKSVDYPSLIPALQSNNIDLIISSMAATEEREKSIDFSNEYAKSELALVVNRKKKINNYKDLNSENMTVAVKQGTIGEMWANKNLPNAKIKGFTEVSAGMLDVNNGGSDAFIYDPLSLAEGSKNLSNTELILDPLPGIKGWGIGMRKDEEVLKEQINIALEEIKNEKFFEKMKDKYLKDQVEKYKSYGLDYFF